MATFQTVNAGGPNQGAQNQVTCLESPNQSPILSTQKFQGQEVETSKRRPSIDNQSDQRSNSCPSRSGLVMTLFQLEKVYDRKTKEHSRDMLKNKH